MWRGTFVGRGRSGCVPARRQGLITTDCAIERNPMTLTRKRRTPTALIVAAGCVGDLGLTPPVHAQSGVSAPADATETPAASGGTSPSGLEPLETRIEQLESELATIGRRWCSTERPRLPPPRMPSPAAPAVDEQTPFAFGDFTWLNGSPRNKKVAFDSPFFTPEVRFDTHFMQSFNQPDRPHAGRRDRELPVRRSPGGADQRRRRLPHGQRSRHGF